MRLFPHRQTVMSGSFKAAFGGAVELNRSYGKRERKKQKKRECVCKRDRGDAVIAVTDAMGVETRLTAEFLMQKRFIPTSHPAQTERQH